MTEQMKSLISAFAFRVAPIYIKRKKRSEPSALVLDENGNIENMDEKIASNVAKKMNVTLEEDQFTWYMICLSSEVEKILREEKSEKKRK